MSEKHHKERKPKFANSSSIELKKIYQEDDAAPSQNRAGEFPFTRGVQDTMYRGRLWTMRQYAGFGVGAREQQALQDAAEKGTTGFSVAFDLPTQMGYDSDHIMASGEVGKVGVAISSLEDMDLLLDDLPLGEISTSMTINSTAGILLALYIAVAKKRGVSQRQLKGNDPKRSFERVPGARDLHLSA